MWSDPARATAPATITRFYVVFARVKGNNRQAFLDHVPKLVVALKYG